MTITAPTDAPELTAVDDANGGYAGTYYFAYSYSDGIEESDLSPVANITITDGQHIDISDVTPLPEGVTSVNLYMSEAVNSNALRYGGSHHGARITIFGFLRSSMANAQFPGLVKLSVDPVNPASPIAVGDNDPRLGGGGGGSYVFNGVHVYASTSQNLPPSTQYPVAFNTERYKTQTGYHNNSTNNSRITIPTGFGGKYRITGGVRYTNSGSGGRRELFIRLNGSTNLAETENIANSSSYNSLNVTTTYELSEGDYIELCTYQDTPSDIPTYSSPVPFFCAELLG